jgi:hypothetical protein
MDKGASLTDRDYSNDAKCDDMIGWPLKVYFPNTCIEIEFMRNKTETYLSAFHIHAKIYKMESFTDFHHLVTYFG